MRLERTIFCLSLIGVVSTAAQGQAKPSQLTQVRMELPKKLAQATRVGPKKGSDLLHISLVLPFRDPAGIQKFVDSVSDPKSPSYRHFISPSEVGRRFGPSSDTVNAVKNYLVSQGFKIRLVAKSGVSVLADGTVSQAQKAFHTTISEYSSADPLLSKGPVPFTYDVPPSVPAELGSVVHVGGLENFTRPKHGGYITPTQVRTFYNLSPVYGGTTPYQGTNRTIGISNFDGYRLSNIPLYISAFSLPTPTAGAGSNVTVVSVDGQNGNNASTEQGEGDLDIQNTLGMAPLCNLRIYDNGASDYDLIGVLTQEADDNLADLVTESYGWNGSSSFYLAAHNIHLTMNAQGMTYMAASGDEGSSSYDYPYPKIDPEVLSVGGTELTFDSAGNRITEVGWSGSGGGYDATTDPFNVLPAYQKGNGVPTNIPYRLAPDVALDASENSYYLIYYQGSLAGFYGTSGASPTMAGGLADVEQALIAASAQNGSPQRFGRVQDLFYSYNGNSSIFYDVTSGSNGSYTAGAGWDFVTGWGALNFANFETYVLSGYKPSATVAVAPSLMAGQSATGTVTISGTAPTGGLVVNLSSSSTELSVPSSITIPSGSSSKTFSVTTSPYTASYWTNVTIQASIAGAPNTYATVLVSPDSAAFTSGNLALLQTGDGLTNPYQTSVVQLQPTGTTQTANEVLNFLNQANTATPALGFVVNPNAKLRGSLNRSQNGLFLSAFGYQQDAVSGLLDSSSTTASGAWGNPISRTWSLMPFTGSFLNFLNPSPSNFSDTNSFSGSGVSAATTVDGSKGWFVGDAKMVNYAPIGASSSTTVSTAIAGSAITAANGNLFFTANANSTSSNNGFYRLNGTPTSSGNSTLALYAGAAGGAPNAFFLLDGQNALYSDAGTSNSLVKLTLTNPGSTWDNISSTPTVGNGLSVSTLLNYTTNTMPNSICSDGVNVYATASTGTGGSELIAFPLASSGLSADSATVLGSVFGGNQKFLGVTLAPEPSVVSAAYNANASAVTVAMRSTSTTSGALNGYGRAIKFGNVSFSTYRAISAVGSNLDYVGHIQTMKTDSAGNQYVLQTQANSSFTATQFQILTRNASGSALTGSAQITGTAGYKPVSMSVDPSGNGNIAVLLANGTNAQIQLFTNNGSGTLTTGTLLNNSGGQYTLASLTPLDLVYSGGVVTVLWSSNSGGAVSDSIAATTYSGQTQSQVGSTLSVPSMQPIGFALDGAGSFHVLSSQTGTLASSTGSFRIDTVNAGFTSLTQGTALNRDNTQLNTITNSTIQRQLIPMGITIEATSNKPIVYFAGANGTPAASTPDSQAGILGSFVAWRFLTGATAGPEISTFRFFPGINW